MRGAVTEQNYWPGYLDALINVMLNLLFLVAVFAIGLLMLNIQTMSQQRQLTDLGAQSQELLDELGLSEPVKSRLASRLEQMDVAAMVDRRRLLGVRSEEVARQESFLASQRAAAAPAPAPTPAPAPALAEERPDPAMAAEARRRRLEEVSQKVGELEQRLKELNDRQAQGQRQLSALQASRAQQPQDRILDFRIAGRPVAQQSAALQEAIRQALGAVPQAVWEYAADEFAWPRAKSTPLGYAAADKAQRWNLVVFADLDNPRVLRESFARGNAIREWMVQDGHVRAQIHLELRSAQQVPGLEDAAYRQVFMVPRP